MLKGILAVAVGIVVGSVAVAFAAERIGSSPERAQVVAECGALMSVMQADDVTLTLDSAHLALTAAALANAQELGRRLADLGCGVPHEAN